MNGNTSKINKIKKKNFYNYFNEKLIYLLYELIKFNLL